MAGFNYLFDAVGGYLGLATNGNASGGWVNPTFVTQGPIAFSTPFETNLPVFVYADTTMSAASTASFSGPVQGLSPSPSPAEPSPSPAASTCPTASS